MGTVYDWQGIFNSAITLVPSWSLALSLELNTGAISNVRAGIVLNRTIGLIGHTDDTLITYVGQVNKYQMEKQFIWDTL